MPILGDEPITIEYPIEDGALYASQSPETAFIATSTPETEIDVIKRYFGKDAPLMIKIARCESQLSQTNKDGSVLKGQITPLDRGLFQISLKYHQKELDELNLNVAVLDDNVHFAHILFERNGTSDWLASKGCWG